MMRFSSVVGTFFITACAVGIAGDLPALDSTNDDEPDAGSLFLDDKPSEREHPTRCQRPVRIEVLALADGGRVAIGVYEACKPAPSRDLGDPPP